MSAAIDARDALDHRVDLVDRDRLTEIARVERISGAQRRSPLRRASCRESASAAILTVGLHAERRRAIALARVNGSSGSPYLRSASIRCCCVALPSGIVRAVGAGDGHVDAARAAVVDPDRVGLGDAGERAREIGVVADRHGAIQRQHAQRCVAPRLAELLGILTAGGGVRVGRALHAERSRQQRA